MTTEEKTRVCRKCRDKKLISELHKIKGEWRCKDDSCKKYSLHRRTKQNNAFIEAFKGEPNLARNDLDLEIESLLAMEDKEVPTTKINGSDYRFSDVEESNEFPWHLNTVSDQKILVFSAAVNDAPVNQGFLSSLQSYCKAKNAQLVIVPIKYNRNGGYKPEYIWDKTIAEYFTNARFEVNSNCIMSGETNIQATAVSPLSGMDSLGGNKSVIVPHPRIELKSVATQPLHLPKLMVTTGAITEPRYTRTKAGQKGQLSHSLSAVVIEVENDKIFHFRHLHYKDNGFYDLNQFYGSDGTITDSQASALVLGDAHVGWFDPDVYLATFSGDNSLLKLLKPKSLIWHDLLDQYARNHHHRGDPFNLIAKHFSGKDSVMDELLMVVNFVIEVNKIFETEHVFVGSNHNDALTRWIKEADWKSDPINAEVYLETALAMARSAKMTNSGTSCKSAFGYWMEKLLPAYLNTRILGRRESFSVEGVELSQHGDQGSNGSRGSIKQFDRTGCDFIVGHSHTPGISGTCYQVGTSSRLLLEYNQGLSSWLNTHAIVHPNGTRQLINIIDGKYTL